MTKKGTDRAIIWLSVAGILISTYALYIEMSAVSDPAYKAYCDIAESVSCTKVLTSDYSKGFGVFKGSVLEIPNCIYGIIFYCLMIILTTYDSLSIVTLQFLLSLLSVLAGFYLAYLLIYVLKDFCLVCVSTYVVNALLATMIFSKLRYLYKKCRIAALLEYMQKFRTLFIDDSIEQMMSTPSVEEA